MTTKHKIIGGFLLMVSLLGLLGFLGYSDIQKASDSFMEYRRQARFNVITSDTVSYVIASRSAMRQFTYNRDVTFADLARKEADNALGKVREAGEVVKRADRKEVLAGVDKDLRTFRDLTVQLQADILNAYKEYSEVVLPTARDSIKQQIDALADYAKSSNNAEVLYGISQLWDDIASARSSLSRFSESGSLTDADRCRVTLEGAQKAMEDIKPLLASAEGQKLYANLAQTITKLSDAFVVMDTGFKSATANNTAMNTVIERLLENCNALSTSVDKQMAETGETMLGDNASSQQQMLTLGGIGLLLGLVTALSIIYGIVHVLKELAVFANATAQGNFNLKLNIREKGEIGSMVEAMLQIPTVLGRVTQQANVLANNIVSGKFRERLQSGEFSGSFADLTKAVNTVSDAYTGVMDSLPLPLMACDKKSNILFLNQIGQTVLGGNYTESQCSGHLNAAECNSDKCFGACAMSKNGPHSGETSVYPQGKRMDISVAALPLHDLSGMVTGYMEIMTDLTEIKAKQNTMLRVAQDASTIADRVAAASEELAAQVELITNGAEMQRSRVESTASAMMEMNSTVMEVARSAGQASEQSEGTRQKAEQGAGLVNKVVSSINTVNNVAVSLQDNMQELGKQAEGIGGVMNVIADIADQTNLLALNAAIEAARAGEAGRGFAVVADEVRKLAEKTMQATKEVGDNISAIQNSARTNIGEVSNAVKSIVEATSLANSSGDALKEIVDLAAANSSVVTSIATAAEQQSATSEEINRAIEEINRLVGETTDGMMQSSAAVQDLSKTAQELRHVMDSLK